MIFKFIKLLFLGVFVIQLSSCSSSSSSGDNPGSTTSVNVSITTSPARSAALGGGPKNMFNSEADIIILNKAYLVISSTTIVTDCSGLPIYSELWEGLLNGIIPQAHAHTASTPTSTGVPYVIDLLAHPDNLMIPIGGMSPSVGNYCGADIDLLAADVDAENLPVGPPSMIGKSLYIEASYIQAPGNGGATGDFIIDTSAALSQRNLLLSALMMISENSPDGSIAIGINYDTWFDAVDLAMLDADTATGTDPNDASVIQLMQNISASIKQL